MHMSIHMFELILMGIEAIFIQMGVPVVFSVMPGYRRSNGR